MSRYPLVNKYTGNQKFEQVIDVGNGVMFIGEGPIGNDKRGPTFDFASDGFLFNGSEDLYNGTGGGVCNLKLFKRFGITGGTAIKLTATGTDRRCGETLLNRLLIYGAGNSQGQRGLWANGIWVDGSMLTTSGSAGIRTTVIENVRISDCTEYAVYLNNAVHCKINGLQLDPGQVASKSLISSGQNIQGTNLVINGDLTILDTSYMTMNNILCYGHLNIDGGKNIVLNGYIKHLHISGKATDVTIFGNVQNLYVDKDVNGKLYGSVSGVNQNNSTWFLVR